MCSFVKKLRKYRTAYLILKVGHFIQSPTKHLRSRIRCWIWDVKVADGVRFLGVPRIRNLGHISIGSNTRIISDNRNNVGAELKTTFETGVDGEITIGKGVGISNSCIVSFENIIIEDEVFIGGGVRMYDTDFHSLDPKERLMDPNIRETGTILIRRRAFIGAHSTILKGVTIGENSIVALGSVVTKNVGENEIWGGVPARKIRDL